MNEETIDEMNPCELDKNRSFRFRKSKILFLLKLENIQNCEFDANTESDIGKLPDAQHLLVAWVKADRSEMHPTSSIEMFSGSIRVIYHQKTIFNVSYGHGQVNQ